MFFNKPLLSKQQETRLVQAIQLAELQTSGEIRVHIDKTNSGDALETCKQKFSQLNMYQTKERNGILFYLAIESRCFAVWGDEGIHLKVNNEFWDSITQTAISCFKDNDLIGGLEQAIKLCGEKLKTHFPLQHDDKDELPNTISY